MLFTFSIKSHLESETKLHELELFAYLFYFQNNGSSGPVVGTH